MYISLHYTFIAFNYCMCFALLHQRRFQKKKSSKVMKRKEKLKNCKKAKLHFADVLIVDSTSLSRVCYIRKFGKFLFSIIIWT